MFLIGSLAVRMGSPVCAESPIYQGFQLFETINNRSKDQPFMKAEKSLAKLRLSSGSDELEAILSWGLVSL